MRKLFIILVSLIAVVTFITAYDNKGGLNIEIPVDGSENVSSEAFSPDQTEGSF